MEKAKTVIAVENRSGNFAWKATAEVTEAVLLELAKAGLVQIMQRSPVSKWEKAMAYPGVKAKRPAGFTRDSIAFSKDGAEMLNQYLQESAIEIDGKEVALEPEVEVSLYESTTATPKYAQETGIYAGKKGDVEKLKALALKVNYGSELGDGITPPTEFLIKIKAYLKGLAEGM